MTGFEVIDYSGKTENEYFVFDSVDKAKAKFVDIVRVIAKDIGDTSVLEDLDDIDNLAIYAPKGDVLVEIAKCNIEIDEKQSRAEYIISNFNGNKLSDIIEFMTEDLDDYGQIRYNDDHTKHVSINSAFDEWTNEMIISFIKTGFVPDDI